MSISQHPLDAEVDRVNKLTRAMIDDYVAWGDKIVYGSYNTMYGDLLEFVNFRIETADSCLSLIKQRKVADALGLSRSLLENYLLLMLMCRGRKYFIPRDLSMLSESEFKAQLQAQQSKLRELQAAGKTQCLEVKKLPRAKRHLMYVFDGLPDADDPSFVTPVHFFHFDEFTPEVLRLKDENYFQPYEYDLQTKKAIKDHQQEAESVYRHYLSYEALLHCLELNGLVDAAVAGRIQAHYTFLGKFLHPTRHAARELHDPNHETAMTAIGMRQAYSKVATLLASLYVCYLVAGLLDEIAGLIENSPAKYVKQPGTESLRSTAERVATEFPYFWFLFNDPPMYDRFLYCVNNATDDELAEWGHYSKVPLERVPFTQYIYGHLRDVLNGGSNERCGVCVSPVA